MQVAGELAGTIQAACERWGPRPAVTHRGRTLTYAELWQRILALARAYRSLGIRPGDRVVCQLPACPEHIIAVNAAWACGAIHVGASKDLTGHELAALVARVQATAAVYQAPSGQTDPLAALRILREAHPSTMAIVHGHDPEPEQHALGELLALPAAGAQPPAPSGPHDTALLVLTSGTTGKPKAVMETLPALWAKMAFFAHALSPGQDDVHLMYLPVCHAFGLKLSLMALASGGRLVLLDRFSPQEALRLVDEEGVTVLPGTPTHLKLLLDALDPARHRVDTLRGAVSAAAPLPPDLVDGLHERLGVELLYVYGCSEGFLTCTTDREDIRRGSVGRTVFRGPGGSPPDGSVAILDRDRHAFLPPGEVGEIAFGASRPVRYWGEPAVATDGWYRTGDLGWLDPDGRLFVSGRLKDVVNRGGLKVASGEVESALARHPRLADAAIVAAPDPVLGEAICACIIPTAAKPPTLAELRAFLSGRLARHKLPDELCVLESIPRSGVGKIDRDTLGALVVEGDLPRERLRPTAQAAATGPSDAS
ncbi:MAG: acyl--CoA ligase [Actinomycetota bacterium]|nr:acyl--CoA ligase [Actinomycetota bacterium]